MEYSYDSEYQCKTHHYSFSMFLKTILNTIVISVDQIGVVPWCLIWWFIWFLVHTAYKRLFLVGFQILLWINNLLQFLIISYFAFSCYSEEFL